MEPAIKKRSGPRHHLNEVFTPQMNKRTTVIDQDPSSRSVIMTDRLMQMTPMSVDRKHWRKKLTKKESIMFRPSLIENMMLDTIVLKVFGFT